MAIKKVLFVITKSNWGGAQRYVYDVATNLDKTKFEPVVAFGGTGWAGAEPGRLKVQLDAVGVRTIFIQSFMRDISLAREWGALMELRQLFKTEKPDVVHLNSSKAGGLGALAARLAGVKKIIFTSHGLAWDEDRNFLARSAIYLSSWATFVLCHKVILITQDSLKRAKRMPLVSKKLRLIHNGISPIAFMLKEDARTKLLESLNLPAVQREAIVGGFWIGALGELTWNKGYHTLLRAAGDLARAGKQFYLVILGDGEERSFLDELVEEEKLQGRVFMAGFVPEGASYLKAFDMFALASVKEGLPYVLMEAGLAGLPTVATKVGGVPDLIGDQVSGLLAKPKSQNDLGAKLKNMIEDDGMRTHMGAALKVRIEAEFTIGKMVAATAEIY